MNRMSRRCLIGILGGAIASIVLIAALHYSNVNLLLGVLVGAVYSAGIRPTRWAYVDNLMAGASLGIPLWGFISVIAVPIMVGQRPEWSAEEMRQHFPALVAWVVYGATLGIAIQALQDLAALFFGPEPESTVSQISVKNRIVILGGGFAGMHTAECLEKKLPTDFSTSITLVNASPPQLTRVTKMLGISLMVMSMSACRHPESAPVTLTFLDPEWAHDLTERNVLPDERLQEFTRQTGIRVKHLPAPEPALDQLGMARELLREGAAGPDVLGIDVVWPATLSQDLIDLKPYFAKELISVDPDVIASYTIKGKLVAVPFHADVGVLFYRRDLLQEYGYGTPPRTWDELEKMAARIQQGERAKGQRDFWGFVWPGAAGEGLTCNALEWQVGEGGGRIIEADNTISVNNPKAIRTWQRAAHWIGLISSPNVVSYEEWDAVNAFYLGKAAFFRGWARSYNMSVEAEAYPAIRDTAKIGSRRIGITNVPAGNATQAAILGGFGLGVSRSAVHPAEALELVRFLLDREIQSEVVRSPSESLKRPELHDGHAILEAYGAHIRQRHPGSGVISRPSTVAGQRYEEVDHAYIRAVHSVLTGKTTAPDAAAGLEKELVRITGFKTKTAEHVGRPPVEAIHGRR